MTSILFVEKEFRTGKLGMLHLSKILKNAGHTVDIVQIVGIRQGKGW